MCFNITDSEKDFLKKVMKKTLGFSDDIKTNFKSPENTFGVFVSVERNPPLKDWPEEIHGCIGNWNDDFSEMNNEKVIQTTFDVAFLGKVIDELQPSKQVKVKEDVNITIRDGGKFK